MTGANGVGLDAPTALQRWWRDPSPVLAERLYRRTADRLDPMSHDLAIVALRTAVMSAPDCLLPVTYADDCSFACLVLRDHDDFGWQAGQVVRWHLGDIEARYQGALLDVDIDQYMESLLEEFGPAWAKGYKGFIAFSESYKKNFLESQEIPKSHQLRPFQLACQNVIIGLAAFRRDHRIDGLAVPYWQTCDTPHVATNEGNRALSALMLCDAFQSGGTMEITFEQHPERRVPASLRRYGRTVGVDLGAEIPDGKSISPREARALFWAVTPMPDDLRERCLALVHSGACSVERLCYSILSPVWKAPALDFMLACCSGARIVSILEGGAAVDDRVNRSAEVEILRAALMVEMLIRRLDSKDVVVGDGQEDSVRLFEDTSFGVQWHVGGDEAIVEIQGFPAGALPWQADADSAGSIVVLPRPHPIPDDYFLAEKIVASGRYGNTPVVILTSSETKTVANSKVPTMRCPMRLPELDLQIERSLSASRLGRA